MSQLDFGLIGNCQISALVDRSAKIVWCCMPRLDSPSIFESLLDSENGGYWSIQPVFFGAEGQKKNEAHQYYLRNTNILITLFNLPDGSEFEVIDFVPRFSRGDHNYKPPQIIRIVRPIKGVPKIVVSCRPRFDYGREALSVLNLSSEIVYESREFKIFFSTDTSLSYVLNETPFELTESKHFVLSYGAPFEGNLKFNVEEQLDRTTNYWKLWSKGCNIPFEFQNEVIRSALVLKLHVFEDTGAIIAATTTSIPESPDSGRTWDYRYCWLRDAYFVVTALNKLGQFEEMESFIRYLQNVCAGEPSQALQPVYGIDGRRELIERELSWLPGFKGHGPVRVGNAAYKMIQHDVYGEMVLAIAPAFFDKRLDRTDLEQALGNVTQLIHQAILNFDQPDAGIWEFRGIHRHSVFSKMMNWAAVDRGVRIAGRMRRPDLVAEWTPICERMRKTIEKNAWNDIVGYYTQDFGGDSPDAAILLMRSIHFVAVNDSKFQKTIDSYSRLLRVGGGVYRYRTPDDFGIPKTTFTVCAFWMADALWGAGRKSEARELFSSVIRKANHLGLLSEDMDPESGELWGNFPQTYSHVGLINTAMKISQSWDEAF